MADGHLRILLVDPRGETRPYDDALAGALAARGHAVEILACAPRPESASPPPGVELRPGFYRLADRLPGRLRRIARGVEHPLDLLAQAPRLVRGRPDVIHLQWLPLGAVDRTYWRALSALLRVPVVYTAHDARPNLDGARRRRRARANVRAFPRIIVHSRHGAGVLTGAFGVPAGRVSVIPHGALVRYRELDSIPPDLPADVPVVAFAGLIRPYKGLDVLLDAWPAVRAARPDALLVVAGRVLGDPVEARLRALAADPTSGVRADLRFVADAEFAGLLARADVVALPYRRIDQSGVLFAAIALGRPLVVTRVGGFPEVVETYGLGAVVDPDDPTALADALQSLLGDPARRAACAAAARAAADGTFSWETIAEATERVYRASPDDPDPLEPSAGRQPPSDPR